MGIKNETNENPTKKTTTVFGAEIEAATPAGQEIPPNSAGQDTSPTPAGQETPQGPAQKSLYQQFREANINRTAFLNKLTTRDPITRLFPEMTENDVNRLFYNEKKAYDLVTQYLSSPEGKQNTKRNADLTKIKNTLNHEMSYLINADKPGMTLPQLIRYAKNKTLNIEQNQNANENPALNNAQPQMKNPLFAQFEDALKKRNDFATGFLTRNPETNEYPIMTAEDVENFRKLETDAFAAATSYIRSNDGSLKNYTNNEVREARRTIGRELSYLKNAEPGMSLSDMMRKAKERTVNVSPQNAQAIQNAQGQNIPMNITNRNGNKVSGMFIPNQRMANEDKLNAEMSRWQKQYPDMTGYFKEVDNQRQGYNVQNGTNVNLPEFMANNFSPAVNPEGGIIASPNPAIPGLVAASNYALQTNPSYAAWQNDFGRILPGMQNTMAAYPGAQNGSSINGRQDAMSYMAKACGCPNAVCRSYPISFNMPDGSVVSGSFTSFTTGNNISRLQPYDSYLASNYKSFNNPSNLKSVSDLNNLDYISGTSRRRPQDMTYNFGNKGQCNGVTGINNTSSFCTPNQSVNDLNAMSNTMADRLSKLSSELMRFNLMGFGLMTGEIAAVLSRISQVMNRLQPTSPNPINVYNASGWQNTNLNNLASYAPNNGNNAVNSMNYAAHNQNYYQNQAAYMAQPQMQMPAQQPAQQPVQQQEENRVSPQAEEFADLSRKFSKMYHTLQSNGIISGSKEYDNMSEYCYFLRSEFRRMANQNPPKGVSLEDFAIQQNEKKQMMMDNLRDLSQAYLDRHGVQTKKKPTKLSRDRDFVATTVNEFAAMHGSNPQNDMEKAYTNGQVQMRKNSFKNMDPKFVAKVIKRTEDIAERMSKENPEAYTMYQSKVHGCLNEYIREVKEPEKAGLTPQDITKAQDLGATLPKTPQYAPYRNNMMPPQMGYAPAPNVQRGVIDLDEPGHSIEPQNNYSQPKPPVQNKNHSGPVM